MKSLSVRVPSICQNQVRHARAKNLTADGQDWPDEVWKSGNMTFKRIHFQRSWNLMKRLWEQILKYVQIITF